MLPLLAGLTSIEVLPFEPPPAAAAACGATVLPNTKCPDTAYKRVTTATLADCCALCAAEAPAGACLAFVFSAGGTDNCKLKTKVTSTESGNKGFSCGIFPGGGPLPAPTPPPTPPAPPPPTPAPTPPDPSAPRPHFVFVLQDDLGFDDVGFNNPESVPYSPAITALAREGMVLNNHYVHWHCSPTRRSLLTGRLPIHHTEALSSTSGDEMDLRWQLLSQKLAPAGYTSYWYGKGHTGYKSMGHMPTHRDFAHWTGYMGGAQSYTATARWSDALPYLNTTYSSILYGEHELAAVAAHAPATPMFLYVAEQAVHEPYDAPPDPKPAGTVLQQMLWSADAYVGKLVALLKAKGMWDNTLVVYSADNGGTTNGTNFPKRGQKHTNWQGGMNVAAFVSGGFLPAAHRGSSAAVALHIVDWYATFCALAGVGAADGPPTPPLPVDPADAADSVLPPPKDIYGAHSWPDIDGVDAWPILMDAARRDDPGAAHASLALSREVLLVNGTWKIVVAQPSPKILAMKFDMPPRNNNTVGWRLRNHTWLLPETYDASGCGLNFLDRTNFKPCLFNVLDDPREMTDLSQQQPELLTRMWRELNASFLTWFPAQRSPAALLGPCNETCAKAHWKKRGSGTGAGPICGVPGGS